MIVEGLLAVIDDSFVGDGSSLELWLRTMVHEVWELYLSAPAPPVELYIKLRTLADDAANGCGVLLPNSAKSLACTRVLTPVCEDLQAFAAMTFAWKPEEVLAADIASALAHLKEKHMGCIAQLLTKCDIGREMLSSSALVLQQSGKGDAADAHFALAKKLLSGDRLPRIKQDGALQVLVNRHMAADLSVFEVLNESLDLVAQAIEQWKRFAQSKMADEIIGCIA